MRLNLNKKGMEIPIHWFIIFGILLLICLVIIGSIYMKASGEGGLISRLFGAFGR